MSIFYSIAGGTVLSILDNSDVEGKTNWKGYHYISCPDPDILKYNKEVRFSLNYRF